MKTLRIAGFGLVAVALGAVIAGAWITLRHGREPAEAASRLDAAQVERIVAGYLRQHPEAVFAALQAYQRQQQAEQADAAKATIKAAAAELMQDAAAPVGGNPAGDVTIVEFFDYQCPYCKAVAPDLAKALAADGKIRMVYKEFPILGPASITAAKAALAAQAQGHYVAFHDKLIGFKSHLSDDDVFAVAATVGLDVARLKTDMEKPEIKATIKRNYGLADKLRVQGTPAFIIGDEMLPGAASLDELTAAVKRARKG
jgi:protein-disulfide isomerase